MSMSSIPCSTQCFNCVSLHTSQLFYGKTVENVRVNICERIRSFAILFFGIGALAILAAGAICWCAERVVRVLCCCRNKPKVSGIDKNDHSNPTATSLKPEDIGKALLEAKAKRDAEEQRKKLTEASQPSESPIVTASTLLDQSAQDRSMKLAEQIELGAAIAKANDARAKALEESEKEQEDKNNKVGLDSAGNVAIPPTALGEASAVPSAAPPLQNSAIEEARAVLKKKREEARKKEEATKKDVGDSNAKVESTFRQPKKKPLEELSTWCDETAGDVLGTQTPVAETPEIIDAQKKEEDFEIRVVLPPKTKYMRKGTFLQYKLDPCDQHGQLLSPEQLATRQTNALNYSAANTAVSKKMNEILEQLRDWKESEGLFKKYNAILESCFEIIFGSVTQEGHKISDEDKMECLMKTEKEIAELESIAETLAESANEKDKLTDFRRMMKELQRLEAESKAAERTVARYYYGVRGVNIQGIGLPNEAGNYFAGDGQDRTIMVSCKGDIKIKQLKEKIMKQVSEFEDLKDKDFNEDVQCSCSGIEFRDYWKVSEVEVLKQATRVDDKQGTVYLGTIYLGYTPLAKDKYQIRMDHNALEHAKKKDKSLAPATRIEDDDWG